MSPIQKSASELGLPAHTVGMNNNENSINPLRDFMLRMVTEERQRTLEGLAVISVDACVATGPGVWMPADPNESDPVEDWLAFRGVDPVNTAVGLVLAIRHTLREGAKPQPAPMHVPGSGLIAPPWYLTTAAWLVNSEELVSLPRIRMAIKQIAHENGDAAVTELIRGLRWVSYAVVDPYLVEPLIDRLTETPPEQMLPFEIRVIGDEI